MNLLRGIRELRYRIKAASKKQILLDSLEALAILYQVAFAVFFAISKVQNNPAWNTHLATHWGFYLTSLVLSVFYSNAYKLFFKNLFLKDKWIHEDINRQKGFAVSISQLAAMSRSRNIDPVGLHHVIQGILSAIRSEVETLVVDTQGIYINVNLLVEDSLDSEYLVVICRANATRALNLRYPKKDMLSWKSMQTGNIEYLREFHDPDKPYKCILAFPLIFKEAGTTIALGAVSVDSARAKHFYPHVIEKLEIRLQPYLALLKLALVHRSDTI